MTNFDKICSINNAFYRKDESIHGSSFLIYNYRLAWYDDFKAIPGSEELRGITVDKNSGKIWYSLHKFFNVNESSELSEEVIKEKCGDRVIVGEKVDGSLIQVINVNGKIVAKTKGTFLSEQATLANEFLNENENYQKFIYECWRRGWQPIFEIISPLNQVVVYYNSTSLVLLHIRDDGGNYVNLMDENVKKFIEKFNVKYIRYKFEDLNNLLNMKKELKDYEGWVIINPNNWKEIWKLKTDWYISLHRCISNHQIKINFILESILDETIDDVITALPDSPMKEVIIEIITTFENWFNTSITEIKKILENRSKFESRKDFAIEYKNYQLFGLIMRLYNDEIVSDEKITRLLKDYVRKQIRKAKSANEFFDKIS